MSGLPNIGDIIDDVYEVKSMLGKGGFGAVFLAQHIPMQREVALKMLIAHGPNPEEMVERFKREVMAIRILSHPNTVRIFDFRDSANDLHLYYTMEYLKGETFKDLVRREGAQSPRRVKRLVAQVLKSLSEAHSHGIIHRDLKPANLMIVEMHGEEDFVKVLDFGIAKILEHEEDEDNPLTSAGMLVGTLRYMSPEQIKGHDLGPYTDLYSLGLIALELLAGKSVFAGTGRWDIMQRQVSDDPIEVPDELRGSAIMQVLQKALAKNPSERYASSEQMLRDLNTIPDNALSDMPLLLNAGGENPSLTNSSSAHLSSPVTPPPSPMGEDRTEVSGNVMQQVHALSNANASGGLRPPPPSMTPAPQQLPPTPDLTPAPQPILGAPQQTALPYPGNTETPPMGTPAFEEDRRDVSEIDAIEPFLPSTSDGSSGSNKGVIIGVVIAVTLLSIGAGAAFVFSSSSENKAPREDDKKSLAATTPAVAETTPPVAETTPAIAEPEAREITLALTNKDLRATVFKDTDAAPFAMAPGTFELPDGASYTIRLEADGFEPLEHTVDENTPAKLELTLAPKAPPEESKPVEKTSRTGTNKRADASKKADNTEDEEDNGWESILPPTDKKPAKKSKKDKKTDKPEKKTTPKVEVPTF